MSINNIEIDKEFHDTCKSLFFNFYLFKPYLESVDLI